MTPCQLWAGARYSTGYGKKWVNGKWMLAHRWAFLQAHDYLPPVVRHSCDTPLCVNVEHLLPGTQADNVRDAVERKRYTRMGEECAKGHSRWGINQTTGNRKCLECKRLWSIENRRKRRVDADSRAERGK